jgi:hypothetical protein
VIAERPVGRDEWCRTIEQGSGPLAALRRRNTRHFADLPKPPPFVNAEDRIANADGWRLSEVQFRGRTRRRRKSPQVLDDLAPKDG